MENKLKLELKEKEIEMLIEDPSYIWILLAKNKDLNDESILRKLYEKKDYFVKSNVAQNPNTANIPDLMEKLANNKNVGIRCSLASNPNIFKYPKIVKKLLNDDNANVVKFLFFNADQQNLKLNVS